jgi:hypothetical protein
MKELRVHAGSGNRSTALQRKVDDLERLRKEDKKMVRPLIISTVKVFNIGI